MYKTTVRNSKTILIFLNNFRSKIVILYIFNVGCEVFDFFVYNKL